MAPTPGMNPRKAATPGEGVPSPRYGVAASGGGGGVAAVAAGAGACSAQKMVPCADCLHSSQSGFPQERQKAVACVSGWFGQVIAFPLRSLLWRWRRNRRILHRQPLFIHGFLTPAAVLLALRGRGLFLILLLVPFL